MAVSRPGAEIGGSLFVFVEYGPTLESMKSASLKTRYRMQPEKIGKPDPLARRYSRALHVMTSEATVMFSCGAD